MIPKRDKKIPIEFLSCVLYLSLSWTKLNWIELVWIGLDWVVSFDSFPLILIIDFNKWYVDNKCPTTAGWRGPNALVFCCIVFCIVIQIQTKQNQFGPDSAS